MECFKYHNYITFNAGHPVRFVFLSQTLLKGIVVCSKMNSISRFSSLDFLISSLRLSSAMAYEATPMLEVVGDRVPKAGYHGLLVAGYQTVLAVGYQRLSVVRYCLTRFVEKTGPICLAC